MDAQVTVVIPVWDAYAGPALSDAIASVAGQRCPHELTVVDNASHTPLPPVDGARMVRLHDRVNTGAARNAALASVSTPYVVFLDADDALVDGALQLLVQRIETVRTVAVTCSILDARTGGRHRTPRLIAARLAQRPRALVLANAVWSLIPTQGATIMRTDAVVAAGGYGEGHSGEDWVLATSLTLRGPIVFDERPALRYRSRDDSPGNAPIANRTLLANAAAVRARIRSDPAATARLRSLLPAIAVAQALAALVAHPLVRAVRSALRPSHRDGRLADGRPRAR